MTLSQDRPAFVLPWIVVVLAAFAFLPPWMGSLLDRGMNAGPEGEGLQAHEETPAEAVGPALLPGGLAPGGRFSALPMESPLTPAPDALASGMEPATAEPGEAVPVEALMETEEQTEENPGGNRPQEFHHLIAEAPATAVPATLAPVQLASAAPAASGGSHASATELLMERAMPRADGRLELELAPQALAYLLQEQLLPDEVEVAPLTEADAQRRAPWDARLRATRAVEREQADSELSPMTRRQRIEQRAREFLRLLRSEPRQALSFLAVLNRNQLRELGKRLQERGVDARSLLFVGQ